MSYEESWGGHLGRRLQSRCKVCVDGTGEAADISVGDYWEADDQGYPSFASAPGSSVIFARTQRGHDLLLAAAGAGIISLSAIDLGRVEAVQPLQRWRKRTLIGRLAGRLLAGMKIPRYQGFGLFSAGIVAPGRTARAGVGSFIRAVRDRSEIRGGG